MKHLSSKQKRRDLLTSLSSFENVSHFLSSSAPIVAAPVVASAICCC